MSDSIKIVKEPRVKHNSSHVRGKRPVPRLVETSPENDAECKARIARDSAFTREAWALLGPILEHSLEVLFEPVAPVEVEHGKGDFIIQRAEPFELPRHYTGRCSHF